MDYELWISGRYAWFRPGTVKTLDNNGGLSCTTPGLGSFDVHMAAGADGGANEAFMKPRILMENSGENFFLRIPLTSTGSPVALYTTTNNHHSSQQITRQTKPTVSTIRQLLSQKKQTELARLESNFGKVKAPVAQAIQASVMWTQIYNPVENQGAFLPVSRAWTFTDQSGAAATDWAC